MNIDEYYEKFGSRISQESERLFINDFLYPLLSSKIEYIIPQYSFIDRTGKSRRIDFVYEGTNSKIALEVNGETYHAEGIIPNEAFDDNLFRQNEILRLGYHLIRFSYSQLKSPQWRPIVQATLRDLFASVAPEMLTLYRLQPNQIQQAALESLQFFRTRRGWGKGIVVMPTGTGKTILSALDARNVGIPILFIVHRLDILKQSIDAYRIVWPDVRIGILTGEVKEKIFDCDVLFASKDSLRKPDELAQFDRKWFKYIVVDEVHHGQSSTYRELISHFRPSFLLGMTATPDRTDRRDIFELFDYNKVYEISLSEVIEQGFLVPYTYYGLTDNIDYSKIKFQNQRYNNEDLEKLLIIPERNQKIVREYIEKGNGDKAIGFCVSIKHAERMAEVFQANGISAASIHSLHPNRDQLIHDFRQDKIQVVFTVDLFNEGVDFPNVRVLLFLRPTESKTVFMQQLGRGLRLCIGKDRVIILDFIGNYKRANQIRKHLAKSTSLQKEENKRREVRKTEYTYTSGCEIYFDVEVEEILNRQDTEEVDVTKEQLQEAYFDLAEKLSRKPTKSDIDRTDLYKSAVYIRLFGSWLGFLREIGEYTEASYHYPQGTHLGHILSIVKLFGDGDRAGTHFDDEYIRLRGGLGEGRIAMYRRQIKYKLQAVMELGILVDDRNYPKDTIYDFDLTPLGHELYAALQPVLNQFDLSFVLGDDGIPTTRMRDNEKQYNAALRNFIATGSHEGRLVFQVFLKMHAAQQMLAFLYHVIRAKHVSRNEIYEQFFQAPFVKQYCEQEGIEEATIEAAKRRCPFLLNVLDACGVIDAGNKDIVVRKLVLTTSLVKSYQREDKILSTRRLEAIAAYWPHRNQVSESGEFYNTGKDNPVSLSNDDISILRELFGSTFLTNDYYLDTLDIVNE